MSVGEIWARVRKDAAHRVDDLEWRALRGLWEHSWRPLLGSPRYSRPRGFLHAENARRLAALDPAGGAALVQRADAYLRGDVRVLGRPLSITLDRDYALDPRTGYRWPTVHGKRIAHRRAPADPKWAWEVNRCQELPVLATAALLTGDTRYADAAAFALLDWIAKNPPGRGIAWANGFEAGIRAISLSLTFDALAARTEMLDRLYEPAVGSLWQHGRWICRDPSSHSSANNHRVGELVGLLSVALLAPELPDSEAWAAQACSELAREAERQIAGDGTGVEQSFAYTTFVLDLFLVAVALLDAVAVTPPASLTHALEHAAEALWAQLAPGETDPTYGDCDDGRAVRLDGNDTRTGRGVAGGIGARFGSSFARTAASELDPPARWMFGEAGATRFDRTASVDAPGSVLLPDAGLAILRHAGTRVTVDAGPLGYLRLAAHGHADALSVTLSADGDELVVDPGTGTYAGHGAARDAFRGTGFHATVLVDGQDQSLSGGPFLWTRHARSWFSHVDLPNRFVAGEHDGYRALEDPVRHRRGVVLLGLEGVLVYDRLDADGAHSVSVRWPLHHALEAAVERSTEVFATVNGHGRLVLTVAGTATGRFEVVRGQIEPFAGWSSPQFEQVVPASHARWDARFTGALHVATLLRPVHDAAEPIQLALTCEGGIAEIVLTSPSGTKLLRLDLDAAKGFTALPAGLAGRS